MGSCEAANHRRGEFADFSRGGDFFGTGTRNQHIARSALLQKKFGSTHDGFGVEARLHRAMIHDVRGG